MTKVEDGRKRDSGNHEDLQNNEELRRLVSNEVNKQVEDTLGYYKSKPEMFRVSDNRKAGDGQVKVLVNWDWNYPDVDDKYLDGVAVFNYAGGRVGEMDGQGMDNWYIAGDERGGLRMWMEAKVYNSDVHMLELKINKGKAELNETTSIDGSSYIDIKYLPVVAGGKVKFKSYEMAIGICPRLPLSHKEAEIILPGGREIALEDAVAMVVDPFRARDPNRLSRKHRVPGVNMTGNFLRLDEYSHYNGHKLEITHNITAWPRARAIIEEIDRKSIRVEEVVRVPTIKASLKVDGKKVEVAVPEPVGSYHEVTADNRSELEDIKKNSKGKEVGFKLITIKELEEEIQNGYYRDDLLQAGLIKYLGI